MSFTWWTVQFVLFVFVQSNLSDNYYVEEERGDNSRYRKTDFNDCENARVLCCEALYTISSVTHCTCSTWMYYNLSVLLRTVSVYINSLIVFNVDFCFN